MTRKQFGLSFVVLSALCIALWRPQGPGTPSVMAQQAPTVRPTGLDKLLAQLYSKDIQSSRQAASQLQGEYDGLARGLVEALRTARDAGDLDRSWEGLPHLTLLVIGRWRVQECVGQLADLLPFKIDRRTVPTGGKYPPSALYPGATALAAIGNGQVVRAVLARLQTSGDEETLVAGTWVLWKIHGEEYARAILMEAIDDSLDEQGKTNLGKAVKLLTKGESLLSL